MHTIPKSENRQIKEYTDPSLGAGFLSLTPGSEVSCRGELFIIENAVGPKTVTAVNEDTGEFKSLNIDNLEPPSAAEDSENDSENQNRSARDLLLISDEDWKEAKEKHAMIEPLLGMENRTGADVEERAEEFGVHRNTLYNYIRQFNTTGTISALARKPRSDRGKSRLNEETEKIIQGVIEEEYLDKQKLGGDGIIEEVGRRCRRKKFPIPHPNTVRNRIKDVPLEKAVRARYGSKAARDAFKLLEGSVGADYPLQFVQVDHTPVHLQLIHRTTGDVIGRPTLTIAFDVYSRMVTGFFVSMDAPSAMSTGLCLVQSILPKDNLLERHDIEVEWPVYGTPELLHVDNANEFKGNMLRVACEEHGIDLEHRPVARPRYGGHVERAFRTYMNRVHRLDGTTFSSVEEKGEYDSEARAKYTLPWFQKWFARYITEVYHQTPHSGIDGMTPLAKWDEGIYGSSRTKGAGRGLPDYPRNERNLRISFMPFEKRAVNRTGVTIDYIDYWSEVLRKFKGTKNENGNAKKYRFRRDPHDVTTIYFLHPKNEKYYVIPTRDPTRTPMSIWEMRRAKKNAREHLRDGQTMTEERLFRARDRLRDLEDEGLRSERFRRERERSQRRAQEQRSAISPSGTDEGDSGEPHEDGPSPSPGDGQGQPRAADTSGDEFDDGDVPDYGLS